jgi:outer membrane protein TolC
LPKKVISLVLTLAIVFCTPLMVNGQEKTSFSIDECVEMALENNTMLKIKAWDLEKSKVEREEAVQTSKKIDRAKDELKEISLPAIQDPIKQIIAGMRIAEAESVVYSFEGAQGKDVAPRLKEAEELIAKKTLNLEEQNLRINVERTYYNVLMAEDNLKNANLQVERSKEQLKNAQVSFENGVVARDSLLMAEAGLSQSMQNLYTAEKNLELARMSLNKLMGRELSAPLVLTTRFKYKPETPTPLNDMIQDALKLRPEVVQAREMAEVTKLNAVTALRYYAKNTYIYRKAETDAKKAELGLKEAEESIKLAVNAAYLNVQEASQKLASAEKIKAAAEETYRIVDLKYKSQMATTAELLEANEKLYGAQLLYTSSVFDYNVAVAELECWAGKGLEER